MKNFFIYVFIFVVGFCSLTTLSACENSVDVYTKYEIMAEYIPENRTLTGSMKVTFENQTDEEISLLKFNLYPKRIYF